MRPVPNQNTREYIESAKEKAIEQLRHLDCAPSVQMKQVPSSFYAPEIERLFEKKKGGKKEEKREERKEERKGGHSSSSRPRHGAELYDDEGDQDHMDTGADRKIDV